MPDPFYVGGGIGLGPRPPAPPAEPYPAPLVDSRMGVPGPAKTAVRDLVRLAEAHGWDVLVTYAKGSFPNGATGRPGAPKDSLAVRMRRHREQAVAVYVGGSTWSWDTLVRGSTVRFDRYPGLGAFLDGMFGAGQTVAPWHPPYVRSWR